MFLRNIRPPLCQQKSAVCTQIFLCGNVSVFPLYLKGTSVSLHQSFCLWPLQVLISVAGGMEAVLTCACLVPMGHPAPVPLASCSRETAGHVTTPQSRTCSSPTVSVFAESPWTPMTTRMCMWLCLSCITSSHWTMTAWTENFTTLMSPWMSSGADAKKIYKHFHTFITFRTTMGNLH